MTLKRTEDIESAALALRSTAGAPTSLEQALSIVHEGDGAELFSALVRQERRVDDVDVVARLMHHLERIAPIQPALAAYLMGRLYGFSWKTSDHATYNAIELWMHDFSSPEVADALQRLADEPVRPALKKVLSSWLILIRARSH